MEHDLRYSTQITVSTLSKAWVNWYHVGMTLIFYCTKDLVTLGVISDTFTEFWVDWARFQYFTQISGETASWQIVFRSKNKCGEMGLIEFVYFNRVCVEAFDRKQNSEVREAVLGSLVHSTVRYCAVCVVWLLCACVRACFVQ